jgi:leader peptidase (prepilin peptidase)/N-methyltransferase
MLIALTWIDADSMLLPDHLTLSLLWAGILFNLIGGFVPIHQAIIGAVAGYLSFWIIGTLFRILRGMDGMGAGDYKLLAALGAWFGWTSILPIVLISAGVGSFVGITLMALRRANLLTRLPFGVYLAPAGVVMLFFGKTLVALVMSGVS